MSPHVMAEVLQLEHRRNIERVNRTWWKFEDTPLSSRGRATRSHTEKR